MVHTDGGLPKGLIGNPPHEVTEENRQKVRILSKVLTNDMVADEIGISRSSLYKHYSAELGEGKREAVKALGGKVLTKALNGDNDMIKFYLKAQGGWSEKQVHELSGPGGGPIPMTHLHAVFQGLNDDELAVAERILSAITIGDSARPDGGNGSLAAIEGGEATQAP